MLFHHVKSTCENPDNRSGDRIVNLESVDAFDIARIIRNGQDVFLVIIEGTSFSYKEAHDTEQKARDSLFCMLHKLCGEEASNIMQDYPVYDGTITSEKIGEKILKALAS